ncbi:MAG: class I SAM-dependent methyltransferase [Candidatus Kapaibacterium sp.]|jgi:SAM-dependent methyltransferase
MNKQWYVTWFESSWYRELYSHRTIDEAKTAVSLVETMNLPKGSRILDLCCGAGRHAAALAEQGFIVTGIDYSEYLINVARSEYGAMSHLHLYRCDMRENYPNKPFDAIVNFFTSFGYFDTDEENAAVIVNIADSLNDNGYFLLDYLNAEYIKKNLVPFSADSFETAIIESRRSIHNNTIVKNITVIPKDGEREEFEENVKLYTQPMLQVMIENSGFVIESIHGNYDGSDFDVELSPRCIIVAKKL